MSILGYDNLFKAFTRPGLGHQRAGIPVRGALIAFIFIRSSAPRPRIGGPCGERGSRQVVWSLINLAVLVYALLPVAWILSLSLKPTSSVRTGG